MIREPLPCTRAMFLSADIHQEARRPQPMDQNLKFRIFLDLTIGEQTPHSLLADANDREGRQCRVIGVAVLHLFSTIGESINAAS